MEFVNDDGWIGWGWPGTGHHTKRLGFPATVSGAKRDVGVGALSGSRLSPLGQLIRRYQAAGNSASIGGW